MGIFIGIGNTKPAFPYDYYYGVQIDVNVADTALTRVGRPELHVTLPVQSLMRRCLINDSGEVVTYLHPTDSTKTDTGATADLTGTTGQVMVEIPKHYRKFEFDGTIITALISLYNLPGFHEVPKMYISAYEATIDRTTSSTPKLASVVNKTANFRGGNNNTAWDGTYRSLLGLPATQTSLTNFRKYARNRGTAGLNGCGWNCNLYAAQVAMYWLYVIEYANRNCQAAYNAEPTSEGYKQGGLGDGVTTINSGKWNTYNGYYPFVPCRLYKQFGKQNRRSRVHNAGRIRHRGSNQSKRTFISRRGKPVRAFVEMDGRLQVRDTKRHGRSFIEVLRLLRPFQVPRYEL